LFSSGQSGNIPPLAGKPAADPIVVGALRTGGKNKIWEGDMRKLFSTLAVLAAAPAMDDRHRS
jgi:hypothetical protein